LLSEHEARIPPQRRLVFLFNLALALLLEGQFTRSLKLVNRILSQPEGTIRLDLHLLSRILSIMIFMERDDLTTAEYQILSALHYHAKHAKGQLEPLRRTLQSFKRIVQHQRWEELVQLLVYLRAQGGYDELCVWIERMREPAR
jgi:hypothetical protein